MTDREEARDLLEDQHRVNASDNASGIRTSAQAQADEAALRKKKMLKWGLIGGAITIVVVLAIVLPLTLSGGGSNPPKPPSPDGPFAKEIYNPYTVEGPVKQDQAELSGYIFAQHDYNAELHAQAFQSLVAGLPTVNNSDFISRPHSMPTGKNNEFIKNISWSFGLANPKVGLLTLTDANASRYSINEWVVNKPEYDTAQRLEMLGLRVYRDPFSFEFVDIRNESNVLVHTNQSTLVMMDKYIQMDFQLPTQRVYGLGERVREFQLSEGTWTMWARGADSPYDDGTGGKQTYGVHPFVLVQGKKKGDFFGLFFRNSNAQSPLLKFNSTTGTSTLSYITTGGQLEVMFFLHGSAKSVIQSYHEMIGTPNLPPFWSLGWSQASWAYDTQADVENVVQRYADQQIPLETVYLDIPYMNAYSDFSVNKTAFPDLKGFSDALHDRYQKVVVILDAGLSADNLENKYYKLAQELDVLIKSDIQNTSFNGALVMKVWANQTVFLDWLNLDTASVWQEGLYDLFQEVPYDGLWLDMNEATGFCNGECPKPTKKQELETAVKRFLSESYAASNSQVSWYKSFSTQDKESTYYLPFIPGYNYNGNLDNMTLSLNATHPSTNETEYDLHNLYGLMMAEHTFAFLGYNKSYENVDNRPFILSRSTFAGAGRFVSHWTGDNWRQWNYMNYSISGIMSMNMYGIPHTGSDVCGFFGQDLDQEMCARWIQLATFYPLARGHYNRTFNGKPLKSGTEPYNLQGAYLTMARNSIHDRYQFLRHMYTCLFEVSRWGGTCFDPLFYYYAEDENTFSNIEESFMIGSAIKVSPILTANVSDNYTSYFPAGRWVSLSDFSEIIEGGKRATLKPKTVVNAHLRPGSLIPFQNNSDFSIKTTHQLLEKPITIIANRDHKKFATGTLLLDMGISSEELQQNKVEYYHISIQNNTMQKQLADGTHASQQAVFEKLVIVDAEDLADVDFACMFNTHMNTIPLVTYFDTEKNALHITPVEGEDSIKWSAFRQINYGSSKKGDLNLCDADSYQYQIKDGQLPDLTANKVTFTVSHVAKTLPDLSVSMKVIDSNNVNVKWTFAELPAGFRKPFEVPQDIVNVTSERLSAKLSSYLSVTDKPFQISIKGTDGAEVVSIRQILLDSYLNIISSTLNTTKGDDFTGIFGLGERAQKDDLFYKDGVYSIWNRDAGTPFDDGKPAGKNAYGTHPFYMFKNSNTTWVGVYTNLVAAQDWFIKNNRDSGEVNATMFAVGGVADMYFIVDTQPEQILSEYLDIVGKPVLIPQWGLGWHQSRWGYSTLQHLVDVVGNYSANNIPLDCQWSDIDYLWMYRDFTYDHIRFKGLPEFIEGLHKKNMYYVPIIDAGIAVRSPGNYPAYTNASDQDIFIKVNGETFIGQVWPKDAAFPDFFNPKAVSWWQNELTELHNTIAFDGIWEDMNEASNFCGGVCYKDQSSVDPERFNLKYTPTGRNLEGQSIPLDGEHMGGYKEVDTHSLYGTMQVKATHEWFQSKGKRTFIIERSSAAGMGKFGSRWIGDNESEIGYMSQSVTGIMMQGMFGIPFSGADICGFGGNTNGELCARWHKVGAFQPFSRNHNWYDGNSQEPYVFKNDYYEKGISYSDIMIDAIKQKYSLIRYYYTLLHNLHHLGGMPAYRPLFFDFHTDTNAFKNVTNNVMIGDSLKVSVLADKLGVNETDFYFPAGTWCNVINGAEPCFTSTGQTYTFRTKAYDSYLHLREGKIVPYQNAFANKILTSADLQKLPVDFHILGKSITWAPEAAWRAEGIYVNDDGLTLEQDGNFNRYQISAQQTTSGKDTKIQLQIQTTTATNFLKEDGCSAINNNDLLGEIHFYNAKSFGIDGKFTATVDFVNGTSTLYKGSISYDSTTDRLIIPSTEACISAISYIELTKTA